MWQNLELLLEGTYSQLIKLADATEEAQAWIEAVTHDPFDDSLSFLANLKTGARRGVPAISRAPRRRRPPAGAAVQADQRDQAR